MILFEIVFRTEDACEGVRAVFAKEPPSLTPRPRGERVPRSAAWSVQG